MDYELRPATAGDKTGVVDIFNYYVEHTYAAYPDQKVPYEFYGLLVQLSRGYPFYVAEVGGRIAGYGLLRPHVPVGTFQRSAELTCFIAPEHKGKGLGTAILDRLIADARVAGVATILASISSENPESLAFHEKRGFVRCGTFKRVAGKFGRTFDEIWMQLFI